MREKVKAIIESHKRYMASKDDGVRADFTHVNMRDEDLTNADLRYANLTNARLNNADLKGANLDFSCMPLWCGDLYAHYDERQIIQQLFHVLSHVKNSKHSTEMLKELLLTDDLISLANKFHRSSECGKLKKEV